MRGADGVAIVESEEEEGGKKVGRWTMKSAVPCVDSIEVG